MHSSLALIPVDPETDELLPNSFQSIFYGHVTLIDFSLAPTENWDENFGTWLAANGDNFESFFLKTEDFFMPGVVAASGAVAILPDCTFASQYYHNFCSYRMPRESNLTFLSPCFPCLPFFYTHPKRYWIRCKL